jgi:pimeloyl-ACP methyl ester carboxylesterase
MTRTRTAVIAGSVAAGALAAGAIGRTVLRRRAGHDLEASMWDLPPDDLGPIRSFDGTELAVRAAGAPDAPILLFVHGFSLDMTTWREQWVDLSVDHRCVLMDLRGHGASRHPADGDLSMRSMGRDVAAVLDAVAPDRRVVIVGHSMGAIATIVMAEVRPDLLATSVSGLVFVGASASELVRGAMGSITDLVRPRLGSLRSAAERVDRLRRAVLASPTDLRGAVVRLTQFGPDAPRHVVEHVVHLAERASSEVWTDGLAELLEVDLRHVLPRVRLPALVVVGEHDRVTPPSSGVELAAALPDGRFVLVEGAGHMAMLERPVELDREIRGFARAVSSAGPHAPRRRRRTTSKDPRRR